jgi:hypothetical protein
MIVEPSLLTVEQFDVFAALPENDDKLFEYIGGEVIEVPSNPYASQLRIKLSNYLAAEVVVWMVLPGFSVAVSDLFPPEAPPA